MTLRTLNLDIPAATVRGLLGEGLMVIRGSTAALDTGEYEEWFISEHLRERALVPGFLRARRYVEDRGDGRRFFLHLYEVESLRTLASEVYLQRLRNPTAGTKQMVGKSRSDRVAATVLASWGQAGLGGAVAVADLHQPDPDGEADVRSTFEIAAESYTSAHFDVTALHLCRSDEATRRQKDETSEGRATGVGQAALPAARDILIVEATTPEGAAASAEAVREQCAVHYSGPLPDPETFRFEVGLDAREIAS